MATQRGREMGRAASGHPSVTGEKGGGEGVFQWGGGGRWREAGGRREGGVIGSEAEAQGARDARRGCDLEEADGVVLVVMVPDPAREEDAPREECVHRRDVVQHILIIHRDAHEGNLRAAEAPWAPGRRQAGCAGNGAGTGGRCGRAARVGAATHEEVEPPHHLHEARQREVLPDVVIGEVAEAGHPDVGSDVEPDRVIDLPLHKSSGKG